MHDFHGTFRDLLQAANLRHGTHGFTSLPKEGVLRIFSPLKIRRLRPGLNPRTWVPKASTLPLNHRSWPTRSLITQSCSMYISIYTYSHEHNNITISSNIYDTTTCFGPVCRPSSGCPKNLLSDYTECVIILEGGRDLVLHHKSWD